MTPLRAAAERFVAAYHARPELVAEQRGWTCTIALVAGEAGDGGVRVRVDDGRVTSVEEGTQAADVVIRSAHQTLCDILDLRRNPNEPYVFGDLTVQGPEAHFLRLDYIATLLCPS